jgi:hypothetical protein
MSKESGDDRLDRAVEAVRNETLGAKELEAMGARVWARVGGDAAEPAAAADPGTRLRGCTDVRALFPGYRAGALASARELLVQDHLRECAACRNAFANRGVARLLPWRAEAEATRGRSWLPRFALVTAAVVAVGAFAFVFRGAFRTAPPGARAELLSAEGAVYLVSKKGQRRLEPGGQVAEGEWVRTSRGTRAVLKLRDGSRVEMREHSELGLSMNRRDLTVHLERGSVIVRGAGGGAGHLLLATEDATASLDGAVSAINRGLKGSRLSVIEGSVRVEDRRGEHQVAAGGQYATTRLIAAAPIREQIGWSGEVDTHLAVLKEMSALNQSLETVQGPDLRYASRLMERVPADAVVFAAIPNYGDALSQAQALFEQRLAENEVLRRWWEQKGGSDTQPSLGEVIDRIRRVSEHLGDEIVLALVPAREGRGASPLLVAEVRRPGLRPLLEGEIGQLGAGDSVQLVDGEALQARLLPEDARLAARPERHRPLALLTDNLVALSPDPAVLQRVMAPAAGQGRFADTELGRKVADAYREGAGLLLAVDLEAIARRALSEAERDPAARERILRELGAKDVKHLLIERKTVLNTTQNRATLSFAGPRQGVASWLAAPAPMGALDFVGPGASFAAAFVVKEPALVLEDLLSLAGNGRLRDGMQELQGRAGVQLHDDLAAPLGNDLALAIDGPLLPVPSWKLVLEVYDPDLVSQSLQRLVAELNRQLEAHGQKGLVFERRQATMSLNAGLQTSQQTFVVRALGAPFQACFLFSDGYLVAAPSDELLYRAVRNRRDGRSLRTSWRFRDLLPADRQADFSGLVYHNLGEAGAAVSDWLEGGNALRPDQKGALEALAGAAKPGLVYVYGEPNQIQVASTGGFFGLGLNHFVGSAGLADLLSRRPRLPARE